jgi:orotate phosphoribosyltransferase
MNSTDQEVISIFKETKALLTGHFILRSGLRSGHFFQCAQVCQHLDKVTRLAELLVAKIKHLSPTTIVSPAMGGLVLGQEVARQLNCRFLFLEKEDDLLVMRRNFELTPVDRVLIVEDVVTRGGRVQEALTIVRKHPSVLCGVACLVDRSKGDLDFQTPFQPLLKMNFPTYSPNDLPDDLKALSPIKPGS